MMDTIDMLETIGSDASLRYAPSVEWAASFTGADDLATLLRTYMGQSEVPPPPPPPNQSPHFPVEEGEDEAEDAQARVKGLRQG